MAKEKKVSPFDYINSINFTKVNMMSGTDNDELAEKGYDPFLSNRGLSYFQDTILWANEMNINHHLGKKPQYLYLLNSIRPRKRFSKWAKKIEVDNLDVICEFYGCNTKRAHEILDILSSDQIQIMREKLQKGG